MPDIVRLCKCFDQIAMGIYYHTHGERFEGAVRTMPGFLSKQEGNAKAYDEVNQRLFERDLGNTPVLGANPAIFSYQFAEPDQWGLTAFRFKFYEDLPVYGAYIPKDFETPGNLHAELIERGVLSAIGFDDKVIWFNVDDPDKEPKA